MKKNRVPLMLVIGWAAAGCVSPMVSAGDCDNNGVCKVVVQVAGCDSGDITVVPEKLVVDKKNQHIQWILDKPQDFKFPADGILIDRPDGEFADGKPIAGNSKYHWFDKNSKTGDPVFEYKYTVNVETHGGHRCKAYDPFIHNKVPN